MEDCDSFHETEEIPVEVKVLPKLKFHKYEDEEEKEYKQQRLNQLKRSSDIRRLENGTTNDKNSKIQTYSQVLYDFMRKT